MMRFVLRALLGSVLLLGNLPLAKAWDYEAHRTINQIALSTLPTNFPGFVIRSPESRERIGFLGGEMDRWRNTDELALKHVNGPDHYIDIEELADYGVDPRKLPVFRYDFVANLALIRKENPDKFAHMLNEKNEDHTREVLGLLPWTMAEMYGKLESGFSYLKAYQEDGGTPAEIRNAEANIIYIMGVMGHVFGDASQPLHTTIHHHGWVGPNPEGYTTARSIHSWIDGGYFQKLGNLDVQALSAKTRPAGLLKIEGRTARPDEVFKASMLFILDTHQKVELLYKLEKQGRLSGEGDKGKEGAQFMEAQLVRAAQLLADIWYSAWQQAKPDTFLKNQLAKRRAEVPKP